MIDVELTYKKPKRFIDLVHIELGEAPSERASTIARILWKYGATVEKVNEALKVLQSQGKAEILQNGMNEKSSDPAWVGIFQDEGDWLDELLGGP